MIRQALYRTFSIFAESKIRKLNADSHSPRETQLAKLLSIVSKNAGSRFGHEHGFSRITSIADYRSAVPVRDYEGFREYIDLAKSGEKSVLTADNPLMFATTSGTTGSPKYIPITPDYMKEFRLASVVSGYFLLKAFPGIAGGTALTVVSAAEEGRTAGGIPYGAISGKLFQSEPFLIKKFISPVPYEVFLIRDYESRYYTLLRLAVMLPVSFFYTLNPSTISLLCRRLQKYAQPLVEDVRQGTITPPVPLPAEALAAVQRYLHPDCTRARQLEDLLAAGDFVPYKIWPTLNLISCWTKAAASFYLADFPEYFGSLPVSDITYGASEGRGTVFVEAGKQMLAIQSHFFEFIPESEIDSGHPSFLMADELEEGCNYYVLFTTSAGLYRYNINDVVKVTGFHNRTPTLEFQYKGGNVSSFTGEKITEPQVTASVTRAAASSGVRFRFFTAIPQFRPEPHYEIWIERDKENSNSGFPEELHKDDIAARIDRELSVENIEYKAKRESLRLSNIEVRFLAAGSYESFRRQLTDKGIADAQIKVSHLNPKAEVRAYFEKRLLP